jgi:gamma-glutamyl hercynylcysteine S-oxide hydrolase
MCRHVAYLGPAVTLASLVIDPPHGLYRQSWAPRMQEHGTVNADGFGVGWYAPGDEVPARYRRGTPMWGDPSLRDVARVTRSAAVLAAVRCATDGTAAGEAAAAPLAWGRWLFSHNGLLEGWSTKKLGRLPGGRRLLSMEAMTDSAFAWAMITEHLEEGRAPGVALAATIRELEDSGSPGRFNFLLTDGAEITATACGDTLWYRTAADAVTVASEPSDDGPGWVKVPDRRLLRAVPGRAGLQPLSALAEGITLS